MTNRAVVLSLVLSLFMFSCAGTEEPTEPTPPPATGEDAYIASIHADALREAQAGAERGDAESQKNLAYMYYLGQGVEKDFGRAYELFEKAAKQGDAVAQMTLGVMHTEGQGVPVDLVAAHKWLSHAVDQGLGPAQDRLDELVTRMTPEQIEQAKSQD